MIQRNPRKTGQKTGQSTSWQRVEKWYNEATGAEGHYYHQHLVMPGILKLFGLQPGNSVLDLACGQGVLAST